MVVTIDGVSFNAKIVRGMKKKEFVDGHKGVLFQDLAPKVRIRKLADIYDFIMEKSEKGEGVASSPAS